MLSAFSTTELYPPTPLLSVFLNEKMGSFLFHSAHYILLKAVNCLLQQLHRPSPHLVCRLLASAEPVPGGPPATGKPPPARSPRFFHCSLDSD